MVLIINCSWVIQNSLSLSCGDQEKHCNGFCYTLMLFLSLSGRRGELYSQVMHQEEDWLDRKKILFWCGGCGQVSVCVCVNDFTACVSCSDHRLISFHPPPTGSFSHFFSFSISYQEISYNFCFQAFYFHYFYLLSFLRNIVEFCSSTAY